MCVSKWWNSNGGTLQYSAPSIERILEVMGEIIKLPDVVKSVKSIVYMAVDKLSETSKKGRMDHLTSTNQRYMEKPKRVTESSLFLMKLLNFLDLEAGTYMKLGQNMRAGQIFSFQLALLIQLHSIGLMLYYLHVHLHLTLKELCH